MSNPIATFDTTEVRARRDPRPEPSVDRLPDRPGISYPSRADAIRSRTLHPRAQGSFTAEIYMDLLPVTGSNFVDLCKTGFYNGVHFHRVIDGCVPASGPIRPALPICPRVISLARSFPRPRRHFERNSSLTRLSSFPRRRLRFMLQFGCPHAKNAKSPPRRHWRSSRGSTHGQRQDHHRDAGGNIPDELIDKTSNEPGTLSMANTGQPNSGGSQFFINTVHNDFLDWWRDDLSPPSTLFGKAGPPVMDVVNKIGKTRCDHNDNPIKPVMMNSITIS